MSKINYVMSMSKVMAKLSAKVVKLVQDDPDYITSKDAADLLGVTRARVSVLVQNGQLRGFPTVNCLWVYRPDVLDRLEYIRVHGKPRRGKAKKYTV